LYPLPPPYAITRPFSRSYPIANDGFTGGAESDAGTTSSQLAVVPSHSYVSLVSNPVGLTATARLRSVSYVTPPALISVLVVLRTHALPFQEYVPSAPKKVAA
jgi:hypothetical protein